MTVEMSSQARVREAINHRQPDRVPYHIGYTVPARARLEAHYGTPNLDDALGNDIARYRLRLTTGEVAPGHWMDEWGVVFDRTIDKDIGFPSNRVVASRSLKGFVAPDPLDPRRLAGMPAFMAAHASRFRVAGLGFSLYERAWSLRGITDLMVDMVEDPGFVDALLDTILEWNLKVLDSVLSLDIDCVLFGDDWGQQRGLIFGHKRWQRFIKPRIAQMYARTHQAGKVVAIHSCGQVQQLFPELIEVGVDMFNPFQPEVMDLNEMKRSYGEKLSFYGGLSVQQVLPFGTPQEVRAETRRLIREIGDGGGYVLAPSHELPADVSLENMLAMIEVLQDQ